MAIECEKCGYSLPVNGRQRHVCNSRRMAVLLSEEQLKRRAELSAATRRVQFSKGRGGFAPWSEDKEFKTQWKRLKAGEITEEQFDEWIDSFNNRERQEFQL